MRALVGCEFSGVVREALRAVGIEAYSCDLLSAADDSPYHFQCDVREVLGFGWDLAIFHPPCTYLCVSGLHWNTRRPGRAALTEEALDFVRELLDAPIPHLALENPIGCIGTRIRKADQTVQPWQFGHDASKATCWWLKNLPHLTPTHAIPPRLVNGKKRWSNQTDSGQNRLGPSEDRWALRSITYPGLAAAIAVQWGLPLLADEMPADEADPVRGVRCESPSQF